MPRLTRPMPPFTPEQRQWFRDQGVLHGHLGGRTAAKNMTADARKARAVKASKAATKARRAKARARKARQAHENGAD